MPVFVLIPIRDEAKIKAALMRHVESKHYPLPRGEYLVSFDGTSKALSDLLGITDGSGGSAVLASISGYFGRAPNEIWEWIKVNWDAG